MQLTAYSIILLFTFSTIIYQVRGTGQYARHPVLNKTKLVPAVKGSYILAREMNVRATICLRFYSIYELKQLTSFMDVDRT